MNNSTEQLLFTLKNIETEEISSMKDSLSDFFKDWVNAAHEMGHLDDKIHRTHTNHYGEMRDLLSAILKYKIENGDR